MSSDKNETDLSVDDYCDIYTSEKFILKSRQLHVYIRGI